MRRHITELHINVEYLQRRLRNVDDRHGIETKEDITEDIIKIPEINPRVYDRNGSLIYIGG